MSVGIISDTHGDIEAVKKSFEILSRCDAIFHCGDVLYHGAFNPIKSSYSPKELADYINEFDGRIFFAKGNCDSDVDQLALLRPIVNPIAISTVDGVTFIAHHGDKFSKEWITKFARKYDSPMVLSGHTHVRLASLDDEIVFINPGSPSLPKGDGVPSVAIYADRAVVFWNTITGEMIEEFKF